MAARVAVARAGEKAVAAMAVAAERGAATKEEGVRVAAERAVVATEEGVRVVVARARMERGREAAQGACIQEWAATQHSVGAACRMLEHERHASIANSCCTMHGDTPPGGGRGALVIVRHSH